MITDYIDESKYRVPSVEDVIDAQTYIINRNAYSSKLLSSISEILEEASEQITSIALKYNITPEKFCFSANKEMQKEIFDIMDGIEVQIMSLIEEDSLVNVEDEDERNSLLMWMLTLGRDNANLSDTLRKYLLRYLYDVEALIAAYKLKIASGTMTKAEAIGKVPTQLSTMYAAKEMKEAMSAPNMSARYIKSKGIVHESMRGVPRMGYDAVKNMARLTLQMTWQAHQNTMFANNGAVGYIQLRGSNFHCDICDREVGFHTFTGGAKQIFDIPLVHMNCMCYRIPIYKR